MKQVLFLLPLALAVQLYAQGSFTNGLIAYYPFNGNANDESTNANHGTPHNAVLTLDRYGVSDRAYQFNGTDAYISAPNQDYLSFPGGEFTISLWAALGAPAPDPWDPMYLMGLDNGPGEHPKWILPFGWAPNPLPDPSPASYMCFSINDGGHSYWLSTTQYRPGLGSWHQYVYTKAATNYGLYIDGVLATGTNYMVDSFTGYTFHVGVDGPEAIPSGITAPLTIGWAESGGFFQGSLDDIRIYDVARTAPEIQELYDSEAAPRLELIKAVKPMFSGLWVGTSYQLQASADLSTWTNAGSPFTATNSVMIYPQYWDVEDWSRLYFRFEVVP